MYTEINFDIRVILKSVFILLLQGTIVHNSSAQHNEMPLNNRVILNDVNGYIVYAGIEQQKRSRHIYEHSFYYWYSASDIKRTQGGYDGKLLHGPYTEFYTNKNLRTKGFYRHGTKTGKWKVWHFNGQLSQVIRWHHRGRRARFKMYNQQGQLIQKGKYKYERYHGTIRDFQQKTIKTKYRNGIEVIKSHKNDTTSIVGEKKRHRFLGIFKRKQKGLPADTLRDHKDPGKHLTPKEKHSKRRGKKATVDNANTLPMPPQSQDMEKKKWWQFKRK